MPLNLFTERLKADTTLLGFCTMYPAPGIVEAIGTGWDFVWIDGQHGEIDYHAAISAVRAADLVGLATLLRVPTHDAGMLGMYADTDAAAIMVPMVNDVAQAKHIVSALKFPPLGTRSYGGRRVIDRSGRDYYRTREQLIVAQIETREAVVNARAIASTPGIDALFFGPDDMKVQMGIDVNTPPLEHPDLVKAMIATADAARTNGKFAAGVAPSAEAINRMRSWGYRALVGGADVGWLRTVAATKLQEFRGAVASSPKPAGGDKTPGSAY